MSNCPRLSQETIHILHEKSLSSLIDVNTTNIQNGDTIQYNTLTGHWLNTPGSGGFGYVTTFPTEMSRLVATTGYSGAAGDEELMGGLNMPKDFVAQNGAVYAGPPAGSHSQAITFGDIAVNGTWRMVAVQPAVGTNTNIELQKLVAGAWTPRAMFT